MTNQPVRILIVDDNPAIHRDYRKVLERPDKTAAHDEMQSMRASLFGDETSETSSFSIDSAYQGEEGLAMVQTALAEHRPYALAFVDMRMPPGWDGLETVRALRNADPALRTVICTAFSDYTWEQISNQMNETEKVLILDKPFDPVRVQDMAVALTDRWRIDNQ